MTVGLLYGGSSAEHEVSLVSAAGVLAAFDGIDATCEPIGITRAGRWFHQPGDRRRAEADTGRLSIDTIDAGSVHVAPGVGLTRADGTPLRLDCVFPLVHGTNGEDGTLQGLLEIADVAYVGSGVTGSAVGMDKLRAKRLWERAGLPVVPYVSLSRDELSDAGRARGAADRIAAELGFPVFVKPNRAGSSVGIRRVEDRDALVNAAVHALRFDEVALVERAEMVREIEVALLGNEQAEAFAPGEIIPHREFYDYEAKYEDPDGATIAIPAILDEPTRIRIASVATAAFHAVDAAGFARVDCFVEKTTGTVYLNEINTIPGFTPSSMYPKLVAHGGVSFGSLVERLVALGLDRHAARKRREFGRR